MDGECHCVSHLSRPFLSSDRYIAVTLNFGMLTTFTSTGAKAQAWIERTR